MCTCRQTDRRLKGVWRRRRHTESAKREYEAKKRVNRVNLPLKNMFLLNLECFRGGKPLKMTYETFLTQKCMRVPTHEHASREAKRGT